MFVTRRQSLKCWRRCSGPRLREYCSIIIIINKHYRHLSPCGGVGRLGPSNPHCHFTYGGPLTVRFCLYRVSLLLSVSSRLVSLGSTEYRGSYCVLCTEYRMVYKCRHCSSRCEELPSCLSLVQCTSSTGIAASPCVSYCASSSLHDRFSLERQCPFPQSRHASTGSTVVAAVEVFMLLLALFPN